MGCGNSKAQKGMATSPSQAEDLTGTQTGKAVAMTTSNTQNQPQQQYQDPQTVQQNQQSLQQNPQYQQQNLPVSAQGRREDQTNRSYSEHVEAYQYQQSNTKQEPLRQTPLQNSQRFSAQGNDSPPQSYRRPDYPETYDKQHEEYEEHTPGSSQQNFEHQTYRENNSVQQSARLQNPQRVKINKGAGVMKIPREDAEGPHIFFQFDFEHKEFHFYNFKKDQWDINHLNRSTDDCPKCPLFKYKVQGEEAEGLQFARYMSYIALSDEVIFIIGGYNSYYSCLEYNIMTNKFYAREPLKGFRNNPSLCRYGQYIYAVSGDLLDKFSTDVARYDTQRNEWVALPELPSPQGFASVAVINSVKGAPPSEKTLKLAALGGLSEKFPKTHNPVLSLFSFDDQSWESIDLSRFIDIKIPKFVHCPIVQTKEGEIVIFGTEGSRSVYKFDVFNMKMTTAGRLPNDEAFNESMRSKEAFCQDDKIVCLAYKVNMKIYRGSVSTNKWEVA